jgi:hypothetical protein
MAGLGVRVGELGRVGGRAAGGLFWSIVVKIQNAKKEAHSLTALKLGTATLIISFSFFLALRLRSLARRSSIRSG